MKQGSFFWSCVQIIVGVIVNEIQTATGALVLQEQIQSQWRGLISNTLLHSYTRIYVYIFIYYVWVGGIILIFSSALIFDTSHKK